MSHKITIIGTGNIASHFAPALEKAGYVINEIYGRSVEDAEEIGSNLYSPTFVDHLNFGNSSSDIFLLAISDQSIEMIASEIILPDRATIAHTSGTISMEVLEVTAADQFGVFYPLQTFTRNMAVSINDVPLFIEANNKEGEELLKSIGQRLSSRVEVLDSERRLSLHLTAVFVNNFINHLLSIGKDISSHGQLDFEMFAPLIRETIKKALKNGPEHSQTGPAIREDYGTMEKHLALLQDQEDYQKIYKLLSQSIIDSKYD